VGVASLSHLLSNDANAKELFGQNKVQQRILNIVLRDLYFQQALTHNNNTL
jgi:hypothetical protein